MASCSASMLLFEYVLVLPALGKSRAEFRMNVISEAT